MRLGSCRSGVTFGTMAAQGVVRDVGRALGVPKRFYGSIYKLIPHQAKTSLFKRPLIRLMTFLNYTAMTILPLNNRIMDET